MIEAMTYRLCDHTTADDAARYRPAGELEAYKKEDPIVRFRHYLERENLWDASKEADLIKTIQDEVAQAVKHYLAIPKRAPESMFDNLYATLPQSYYDQWLEVKQQGEKHNEI